MQCKNKTSDGALQQELDLPSISALKHLPSPKRNAQRTKARQHLPWETNYAAFSLNFAYAAVETLSSRHSTIYDPFLGCGTTLEAAVAQGVPCYGIELNPCSALLARCRVATNADFDLVSGLLTLASKARRGRGHSEDEILTGESAAIVSALIELLSSRLGCLPTQLVSNLCAEPNGKYDSEAVALVAALYVVKKLAKIHFRSNPTWLMKGVDPDGRPSQSEGWRADTSKVAKAMIADLTSRKGSGRPSAKVFSGGFDESPVRRRSISRFLTSPPYLNRLDYVNPSLPELHALGLNEPHAIEALRSRMMGTTKMRREAEFSADVPSETVRRLLLAIAAHPTKASATYYLRFFKQYFEDFFGFLRWLDQHATDEAKGILVLQDSYYKDIKIPIVQIVSELGREAGFTISVIFEESRNRHMGALSPHQRAHAPTKALTEFALLFER